MAKNSNKQHKAAIHPGAYMHSFITMRETLMIKVAGAIAERGWTQRQAAQFLGVSQPRVSDLVTGKAGKFTIDTLILWLLALGKEVCVVTDAIDKTFSTTQTDELVEFYTRAIAIDPQNVGAYMNRGDAYREGKHFDLAIGDYTRAIELEPTRPGPRNQRALAYRNSGQLKAALQEATAMIQKWPDYSGGYGQRAATCVLLEDYDQALIDYSADIALEPERPGAYWNRASIYEHLGEYDKAIADYDKVIALHPTPEFARQARVALMEKRSH
jgi:predicted XRE-type DNA-binding protein/regulator of sirC expression with transglutaminase-like and TPR domain